MSPVLKEALLDRFPSEYWDAVAKEYPRSLSLLYRQKKRFDRGLVGTDLRGRILDAGCGKGGDVGYFACRSFDEVHGIDHSAVMCAFANDTIAKCPDQQVREKVHISQMDMVALDFPDQYFDMVTSFSAIDHIGSAQGRIKAISELVRVLRSGGRFVLSFPNRDALGSMLKLHSGLKVVPHRVGDLDVIRVCDRAPDDIPEYEVEETYSFEDLERIAAGFGLLQPIFKSGVMEQCVQATSDAEVAARSVPLPGQEVLLNACRSLRGRNLVAATLDAWRKLPVDRRGLRVGLVATRA